MKNSPPRIILRTKDSESLRFGEQVLVCHSVTDTTLSLNVDRLKFRVTDMIHT